MSIKIKDLNHKKITRIGPNFVVWDELKKWHLRDERSIDNYSVAQVGEGFGWCILSDWNVLAYGFSDRWKAERYLLNYDWGR